MNPLIDPRVIALLAAGTLLLHEGSYAAWAALGGGAAPTPDHAYFAWLAPMVALALAFAGAVLLARLVSPRRRSGAPPCLRSTWALSTAVVLGLFVAQEAAEAAVTVNAAALIELAGAGGLITGLLSAGIGLLVALLLHAAATAEAWAARRLGRPEKLDRLRLPLPASLRIQRRDPGLLRALAPRAPPRPVQS